VSKDLRNSHQPAQAVEKLVREQFVQPFDLASGPMLRAGLFQTGDSKWIFTYVMHHIISDGWSMNVLLNELLTFYRSYESGEEPTLASLRIQFKDYASWQQQLNDDAIEVHKTYWLQQMEGPLPVLDLPADRLRPAVKTYNGSNLITTLDANGTQGLKTLVRQQGATLFMGLLALVKTLLYRYTGQQDIIIGSPIAGRDREEMEHQLGLYVNTLALRTRFSGDGSFMDLLDNVKQVAMAAYDHQLYSFDALVDALDLPRDLSQNPLFEVMAILQPANEDGRNRREQQDKLAISSLHKQFESPVSKFDLSFSFLEKDKTIEVSVEYNSDIFNQNTMLRLSSHLNQLLTAITIDPLKPIKYLDYLSDVEKHQLFTDFNKTTAPYPKEKSIIDMLESQVLLYPHKIVIQDEEGVVTYSELNRKVNLVAKSIIDAFGTEDKAPVGVLLSRSAELVAVLLGVMKSGRAYIPLDSRYPVQRLNYILQQSGCTLLITEEKAMLPLDTAGMSMLRLEDILELDREEYAVSSLASASDVAYIIYTSGSTGNPKGIAIKHRSVVNFLTSMQKQPGLKDGELVLAASTISFDISVLELFLPLLSGGCMYIVSAGTLADPQRIIAKLQQVKPAVIQATPAFYQMLFESGWQGQKGLKVLYGGDLLSESLADKILKSCGELWNMYGPTETTVWATLKKIEKAADTGNVGKPIHNTTIYITDEQLQPVPVGIPGSIYIGGDGLALGYYRQEALTAERFISSPFNEEQKIYDTGDVGKWNADGTITFLGRKDNQV
ncbi:non-ribosomal peptide synthetase, partial [Niastella populi]|uniref:non-ribosomal peptide synthetase n=1 Tax=Niastella populi TaxID=550983 RepID=UPI001055FED1